MTPKKQLKLEEQLIEALELLGPTVAAQIVRAYAGMDEEFEDELNYYFSLSAEGLAMIG